MYKKIRKTINTFIGRSNDAEKITSESDTLLISDPADEKFASAVKVLRDEYALRKTMEEGACVDKEGNPIPWYTYPAIEYIKQLDFSDKKIFEFGSGNSSLFWSNISKAVVSVDENEDWYNSRLKYKKENMKIMYRSTGEKYFNSILEEKEKFDVIIVDGNCDRDKCSRNALEKLNKNGLIILDNSDRVPDMFEYSNAVKILKNANMIQVDFCGFGPINNYTWITSFFFTRDFDFKSIGGLIQPNKSIGNI